MTTKSKILIIIVTWNKKDYVLNLLRSLRQQTYPQELLDILVVDNASTDGTAQAIKSAFPEVKLIENTENLGGTGGFNTGLRYAFSLPEDRYDYLWLLDNDVLVHREALTHLVEALETHRDLGACGSVMLQLDYPWRINEIGAFFDFASGRLVLNHHLAEISAWHGRPVETLLSESPDLSRYIPGLPSVVEVDYVAAASLLVRNTVARKAGLWKDFFIHFDDVEWCLRIARLGYGVAVCTRSLIWHLSGIAKVPTWVLYYDNRNVLEVVREHGGRARLRRVFRRIARKPLYYALIGKPELGDLIAEALRDFQKGRWGRNEISLPWSYRDPSKVEEVFRRPEIRKVLISPTVNLSATGLQRPLARVLREREDLSVEVLIPRGDPPWFQLPRQKFLSYPARRAARFLWVLKRLKHYDLFVQSDYAPLMLLPFTAHYTLCVNDYGFSLRPSPSLRDLFRYLPFVLRSLSF